jgi:hypothetical protein
MAPGTHHRAGLVVIAAGTLLASVAERTIKYALQQTVAVLLRERTCVAGKSVDRKLYRPGVQHPTIEVTRPDFSYITTLLKFQRKHRAGCLCSRSELRFRASFITILLFPDHEEHASRQDRIIEGTEKKEQNYEINVQPSRVSPQTIILTSPDYKARAATRRPTAPPERVSISVLRERAAAAPVAWALALEEADEAADAKRVLSVSVPLEKSTSSKLTTSARRSGSRAARARGAALR